MRTCTLTQFWFLSLLILSAYWGICAENSESIALQGDLIFNGNDLSGWDGDPQLWAVKDGAITGQSTPETPVRVNTFLIWTNGTVGDFELTCNYRLMPAPGNTFANSGIQYRSKVLDPARWIVGGYQADMEAGPNYSGILYEEKMTRGIMAQRGEQVEWTAECKKAVTGLIGNSAEIQALIRQGDWNTYRIAAQGNHFRHYINGRQTIDVTDNCDSKAMINGVLALQMHVGTPFTAQFKEIRLRRLK